MDGDSGRGDSRAMIFTEDGKAEMSIPERIG